MEKKMNKNRSVKNGKTELLAPVGSLESLHAAVQNGADAVYLSGKNFGARQYASNFSYEEIEEAVRYCHIRDVSVYITVNTLVKNSELEDIKKHIGRLYSADVDGIIVQDLGLIEFVKAHYPDLELHSSTQMSIHNIKDMEFAEKAGMSRVVLAREMSFEEIKWIKSQSDMEIEVFVHGALCISYSGQCLMSSMIGGRSGNRGRCAQPCRQMYDLMDMDEERAVKSPKGQFILSPQELNTLENINDFLAVGVESLKIEGRMKRPEYVAIVVRAYRKAIDAFYAGEEFDPKPYIKEIESVFNRDFTKGHLFNDKRENLMNFQSPSNRGVFAGKVLSYDKQKKVMELSLEESIGKGDELQIRRGNDSVGCRADVIMVKQERVTEAKANTVVKVNMKYPVFQGEYVYKTVNEGLMKSAGKTYEKERLEIPLSFKVFVQSERPLKMVCNDALGHSIVVESEVIPEVPTNRGISAERIKEQVSKLGGTPYQAEAVEIVAEVDLAFPMKALNELRRRCIEALDGERALRYAGRGAQKSNDSNREKQDGAKKHSSGKFAKDRAEVQTGLTVSVNNLEQLDVAVESGMKQVYYSDIDTFKNAAEKHPEVAVIPHLFRVNSSFEWNKIAKLGEDKPEAILASNLGQMNAFGELGGCEVITDYSLNMFNSQAVDYLKKFNVARTTLSLELTMEEIKGIAKTVQSALEVIVYGRIPMMVFQYCPISTVLGLKSNCGKCEKSQYGLKDRKNETFPLVRRLNCRMELLNSKTLYLGYDIKKLRDMGINMLRLNFTDEKKGEVKHIIELHRKLLGDESVEGLDQIKEVTRGHFFRGAE